MGEYKELDKDLPAIWERIKHNIDPAEIKQREGETIQDAIKRVVESTKNKAPEAVERLLKFGFADRAAEKDFILKDFQVSVPITPTEPTFEQKLYSAQKIRSTESGKIRLKVHGMPRYYREQSISFKEFSFRGKRAYSAYNSRGKRITWGVV